MTTSSLHLRANLRLAAGNWPPDGSMQQATSFSLVYAFIISSMPFMAPHISSGISSHRTAEPPNRGHQNQRLL